MPRYTDDMDPSATRQARAAGFDERNRGSGHSSNFYESDAQRSAPRNVGGENHISQQVQHQQRIELTDQPRSQATNNASLGRGTASGSSRPPSYPGLGVEEAWNQKADAAKQRQRQRGYRRGDDPSASQESDGNPVASSSRATQQQVSARSGSTSQAQAMARPQAGPSRTTQGGTSPDSHSQSQRQSPGKPSNAGNSIARLPTPSIMTSVLQPLDTKVQEYAGQMQDASNEISQIEAEIAALLERKRDTEARFMAAKGKHDDYKRQYLGVERALRGEVQQVQMQQQQQVPFDRRDLDDDQEEDEDEDRSTTHHTMRPPHTANSRTESWSSVQKPKSGSRFRLSKMFGS